VNAYDPGVHTALGALIALFAAACGDNTKPACVRDSDCGDGACADVTCVDGMCALSNPIPQGLMAVLQTQGDCKVALCDGDGNVVEATDDTDVPTATSPCTIGTCTNGVPAIGYAPANTACGSGMTCNATGMCE